MGQAQAYSFTTYMDSYKNGKKEGETVRSSYVVNMNNIAMSSFMNDIRVMTNVINQDEGKMTMITYAGENVQGIQMDIPEPDSTAQTLEKDLPKKDDILLQKTEETKNADGYLCRRYEAVAKDAYIEVWMLEGYDIDILGFFDNMTGGMPGGPAQAHPNIMTVPLEKGFPMELYYEPKNKKQAATLTRVSNLVIGNVDTSILDVSHIPMIEIPKN
jgi:hypothetical protein